MATKGRTQVTVERGSTLWTSTMTLPTFIQQIPSTPLSLLYSALLLFLCRVLRGSVVSHSNGQGVQEFKLYLLSFLLLINLINVSCLWSNLLVKNSKPQRLIGMQMLTDGGVMVLWVQFRGLVPSFRAPLQCSGGKRRAHIPYCGLKLLTLRFPSQVPTDWVAVTSYIYISTESRGT